jgi:uncharacterized protein (TIGR02246 family)
MTTPAAALVSPEDRFLIEDLFARYNRAIDSNDRREEFVSLYTPDGVWVSPMEGTITGREALSAWYDDYFSRSDLPYHGGQHRVTNVIIESATEDRIESWCTWIFVASLEGPRVIVMGKYIDTIVKQDGRWMFEKRVIEINANSVEEV